VSRGRCKFAPFPTKSSVLGYTFGLHLFVSEALSRGMINSDISVKQDASWSVQHPLNAKIVKCVIYIRVSTDEQAKEEHYSLDAQEEYCMGEIKKRQNEGWLYLKTISDPGYSGFTYDRPGLIELIKLVKTGEIGVVIVYKRERLFRNADLAAQIQAIFDMHGVRVLSYVEGIHDNSPHSTLMRQFLDANSQFERANTRKRVNDCLRFVAKRGDWKGGNPPYGYRYTAKTKVLSVNDSEAPVVKLIYERIADGCSIFDVAQELRRLKIYGRPRTKRRCGR
jgi:site-specific DNA recombinase